MKLRKLAATLLLTGGCMWHPLPPKPRSPNAYPGDGCADGGTLQLPDATFTGGVPDPGAGTWATKPQP